MNNFVSLFVALLRHAKVLTEDEAKKLVKELHGATLPGTYEECERLVKNLFEKHSITTIEHKLAKKAELAVEDVSAKVLDTKK